MKKNITITILSIFAFFIGICNVNATSLNVLSHTGGSVDIDGIKFNRTITSIDEVNGELVVELSFKNSKETEVMFVMDDSTTITTAQRETLKSLASNVATNLLDNYKNTKIGVYTVHTYGSTVTNPLDVFQELTNNKNSVLSALNTVSSSNGTSGQDFVAVLNKVSEDFSDSAENKIVYLFLSGFNTSLVDEYKTALDSMGANIELVTILLDFKTNTANETPISSLFGSTASPRYECFFNIITSDINSTLTSEITQKTTLKYPTDFTNGIAFNETFSKETYSNFELTLVDGYDGAVAGVDANNSSFTWQIANISNNSDAILKYKLVVKDPLTSDIVLDTSYNLNGNSTIVMGSTTRNYDNSALYTFTNQITSPKTGPLDVIIPFLTFSGISLLAYVYIKRKDKLVQI